MSAMPESRPPVPPFTGETAKKKIQVAEDAWNSRDPARVSMGYTPDTEWRNRNEFLHGRDAVREFQASSAAWIFFFAVSSVKGGKGGLDSGTALIDGSAGSLRDHSSVRLKEGVKR